MVETKKTVAEKKKAFQGWTRSNKNLYDQRQALHKAYKQIRNRQEQSQEHQIQQNKCFYRLGLWSNAMWSYLECTDNTEFMRDIRKISHGHVLGREDQGPVYIRRVCRVPNKSRCTSGKCVQPITVQSSHELPHWKNNGRDDAHNVFRWWRVTC